MPKNIKISISDEYFEEFINNLIKEIEENPNINKDDVKIFGLTVKKYKKTIDEVEK